MAKKIGRSTNTNDTSNVVSITLNSSTAVTLSAANAERVFFRADNNNATKAYWVRLYPAATDNTKHGIYVSSKTGHNPWWEMLADNPYTGEISAIADTDSPTAYVTEY